VADHGGAGEEPDDAERALPRVGQIVRDSRRDERNAARGQPHALIARFASASPSSMSTTSSQ
jgi:hypothetical protein